MLVILFSDITCIPTDIRGPVKLFDGFVSEILRKYSGFTTEVHDELSIFKHLGQLDMEGI